MRYKARLGSRNFRTNLRGSNASERAMNFGGTPCPRQAAQGMAAVGERSNKHQTNIKQRCVRLVELV